MKILYAIPVAMILAISTAHAGERGGMGGHGGKKGHKGAVPVLIHAIKKNATVLGLSDEQLAKIDTIHNNRKSQCHDLNASIRADKKALSNAVLDGEGKDEILARSKAINAKRDELTSLRIDARDEVRDVLSEAQWYMAVGIAKKKMHDKNNRPRGKGKRGGKGGHMCKHHGKKGGKSPEGQM